MKPGASANGAGGSSMACTPSARCVMLRVTRPPATSGSGASAKSCDTVSAPCGAGCAPAAPPTVNDSGALLALAGVLPGPTSALTASAGTCTWPAAVGLSR
ncbi:hypothetical protein FT164_07930 [Bordetella pertussis]